LAADADSTFSYAASARTADVAATANALGTSLVPTTGFGNQSGSYSASGNGTITLNGSGSATAAAGTGQGSTASATFSSTTTSDVAATSVRRIASSSNDQATFTATRQGSSFAASGSGLEEVTAGGLATAAAGDAPAITALAGGGSQTGTTFTSANSALVGQASSSITASSTNVTQAGYGVVSNTLGGTTAGAITATPGINGLAVLTGNQGTRSDLSVIQSLSAF
jgi:hypothetical protein